MRNLVWLFLFILFLSVACQHEYDSENLLRDVMSDASQTGDLSYYVFPESDDYEALPNQDPANPIRKEKVELGRMLFFETGLAQIPMHDDCYETYSCSSCHIPTAGFLPGRVQGIADGALVLDIWRVRFKLPNY